MDIEKLEVAYMLAHARIYSASTSTWTVDDLRASFHLMPTPAVTFEVWCERMELSTEPQETEAELQAKRNTASLSMLGNVKGVSIKDAV